MNVFVSTSSPAVSSEVENISVKLVLFDGNSPTNITHIVIDPSFSFTWSLTGSLTLPLADPLITKCSPVRDYMYISDKK